jgi:hypothetical protein
MSDEAAKAAPAPFTLLAMTAPRKRDGFAFGSNGPAELVKALRDYADRVEAGWISITSASLTETATPDDYFEKALTLTYLEKVGADV